MQSTQDKIDSPKQLPLIMSYLQNMQSSFEKKEITQGSFGTLIKDPLLEIGIGKTSGNAVIANKKFHVMLDFSQDKSISNIVILDKKNKKNGKYSEIDQGSDLYNKALTEVGKSLEECDKTICCGFVLTPDEKQSVRRFLLTNRRHLNKLKKDLLKAGVAKEGLSKALFGYLGEECFFKLGVLHAKFPFLRQTIPAFLDHPTLKMGQNELYTALMTADKLTMERIFEAMSLIPPSLQTLKNLENMVLSFESLSSTSTKEEEIQKYDSLIGFIKAQEGAELTQEQFKDKISQIRLGGSQLVDDKRKDKTEFHKHDILIELIQRVGLELIGEQQPLLSREGTTSAISTDSSSLMATTASTKAVFPTLVSLSFFAPQPERGGTQQEFKTTVSQQSEVLGSGSMQDTVSPPPRFVMTEGSTTTVSSQGTTTTSQQTTTSSAVIKEDGDPIPSRFVT